MADTTFNYNKSQFRNEGEFQKFLVNLDVTLEQYRVIDSRVHEAAREKFVGRELFPITHLAGDVGVQSIGYDILTHMKDATIAHNFDQSQDTINLTRYNVNVPIISNTYRIGYRDLRSSELSGQPLGAKALDSCVYKITSAEDNYLLQGWTMDGTEYEVNGMFNAAGNTYDGSDWATATNIIVDINAVIAQMIEDKIYGPYHLCISPEQYTDINQMISNTLGSYADWIIKRLGGGKIFVSDRFNDNYGVLCKAGEHKYFEYQITADLDHWEWRDNKTRDLFGTAYIAGIPLYYDSNAICALSDIGT
jgi:uncharacterized linocin/CFP29 family protein